jgi:hypothetical protein
MATLSNIASMTGAATAHVDADAAQKAPAAPAAAAASGTTLPADGEVLADATAYRTIDHKFLSHTNGVVSCGALAAAAHACLKLPAGWGQALRPETLSLLLREARHTPCCCCSCARSSSSRCP